MTQKPITYPDELICVLAQFCSSTLLNTVVDQVYKGIQSTDFYIRMQYLEALKMRLNYSRQQEERMDLLEMIESILRTLEGEIPGRVHTEKGDYPEDAQFCIGLIDRLLKASKWSFVHGQSENQYGSFLIVFQTTLFVVWLYYSNAWAFARCVFINTLCTSQKSQSRL